MTSIGCFALHFGKETFLLGSLFLGVGVVQTTIAADVVIILGSMAFVGSSRGIHGVLQRVIHKEIKLINPQENEVQL